MPHRLIVIEAPCRSAFASRHGAEKINAARPWAALAPDGDRLPTSIILRSFAACLSVPKACIGGNATCCTLAVVISVSEGLRYRAPRSIF